jgi:phospholipase C
MHTRREFLGFATRLAGAAGAMGSCLEAIGRAVAIEPTAGTGYLDAEHVVILMQENRAFDHVFGTLRGVRGFNDPRAITLPDGNPVWVQPDAKGRRFVPFRLDIKGTKATWMGSLPHDRSDQTDARNHGLYDLWLSAKRSGTREYQDMPLTLGYYTRADIPFYYAMADAFTICDQYFCSALCPTTPNRCYLWSGTVRAQQNAASPAYVRNDDIENDRNGTWPTFPERLEDHGVSWRVYQNEIAVDSGFSEAEDAWLSNFGDNPLEYFRQYQVQLAPNRRAFVERRIREIPAEIPKAKAKQQATLRAELKRLEAERAAFTGKSLETLPACERRLHEKAFCTNTGDPHYRQLAEVVYRDGGVERRLRAPKGDVFHQFRADVESGRLPTVSWLVGPQEFSDHPSSAWYGAWYIAEALDILTRNPALWKKTIFLLTYDENDGYFDHCPPFVAPHPRRPETGRVTRGIDASVEYVELAQDRKHTRYGRAREGPIGLGYRVPMVVASPWSRGGCVCSQVFDHTSVLQFLEHFLGQKLGKPVAEPNISRWRRTVCGDLTAAFQPAAKDGDATVPFPPRDEFLESIHQAQFKDVPSDFHALGPSDLEEIRRDPSRSPRLPQQEPGTRPACPLPYELRVDGAINQARTAVSLRFEAGNELFGGRAAGAPFTVYALGSTAQVTVRNYAVESGEHLDDTWLLSEFPEGRYRLRAYGPNGFFREFAGSARDPMVELRFESPRAPGRAAKLTGEVAIVAVNRDRAKSMTVEVRDEAYHNPAQSRSLKPGQTATFTFSTENSAGWYDVSCRVKESAESSVKRYAGRVETGSWTTSDPAMAHSGRQAPGNAANQQLGAALICCR